MAKCGCKPNCACEVNNGKCTSVSGSGLPADPYVITLLIDNDTIQCVGGELESLLNTIDTNTVDLTGDGTAANPLKADVILTPNGNVPDPDALGTGNLVKLGPTGIYVSCEDIQDCVGAAITQLSVSDCLDYDDSTNTISVRICAAPNGVECLPLGGPDCPAGGLLVTPSADAGNGLVFGTDTRLFFSSPAIQAGDCITITGTGTPGDPFVISPQIAPEPNGVECVPGQGLLVFPSADANNGLVFGADNRLFINNCPFLVGASQLLFGSNGPCFEMQGDGCNIPLSATLRISDDPCNGLQCRADGLFVEADPTPLPDAVNDVRDTPGFPGLGPFNGTNPLLVVDGPVCINIVNPSPCKNLITTAGISGFMDVGRQSGAMEAHFEIAPAAGGPWTIIGQTGQANPSPPSRTTGNTSFTGLDIVIPPGGARTVCSRTTVSFQGANTGRLFFSERTLTLYGRWET